MLMAQTKKITTSCDGNNENDDGNDAELMAAYKRSIAKLSATPTHYQDNDELDVLSQLVLKKMMNKNRF